MDRRTFLTAGGATFLIPFLGIGRAMGITPEEKAKMQSLAGNLTLSPDIFTVGEKPTMKFSYSAGDFGLKKDGSMQLLIPTIWSLPQNTKPDEDGYTVCELGDIGTLVLEEHIPENILTIKLARDLNPGEKITLIYGDKSGGGGGVKLTDFPWDDLAFPLIIDYDGAGTRVIKLLTNPIKINAGSASKVRIFVPAVVRKHERALEKTVVGDSFFNYPNPPVSYKTIIKKQLGMDITSPRKKDGFIPLKFAKPSLTTILAVVEGTEYQSSRIEVQEHNAPLNLYFGDLHGHSLGSDGLKAPEDYFAYGREMAGLDICILTDHAECIYPANKYNWEYLVKTAEDSHHPNEFITFPAFEWTHGGWGHRCVYFHDAKTALQTGYFSSADEKSDSPDKLYELVRAAKPILIPHHTMAVYRWEVHDPELEPLVEIYSMWGSSEYPDNPLWHLHLPEGSPVSQALQMGYQLGFVGGGDSHHGQPAQGITQSKFIQLDHVNGLTGLWAKDLTRKSVWEALKARRSFATTGARIFVDFRINQQLMGSSITSRGSDECEWKVRGTDKITSVEIVSAGNETVYNQTDINSDEITGNFTIMPTEENQGTTKFYYLRVKQADNNWVWTSPVWINKT
jgi:hypothetical protein